jgi:hypothetical protein
MNKNLKLGLSLAALLIIGLVIYFYFNSLNKAPLVNTSTTTSENPAATSTTLTYLVSPEDTTKYCNGEDMNSADYQKTITIKESTTTSEINPTKIETIKTILSAATTGMCNTVLGQLDITENNGTVYIPQIDGWAGVSITMCSCKPQVEVNLLQIPGITNVIWSAPENIGNELEKADFIKLETPRPNDTISSPLTIKGQARGSWFFEASFPVFLTDWDGKIIAQGVASAKSDWMTTEFVPFEATLTFTTDKNVYNNKGSLILKKDNPSGLSENDDALEIPVVIN